MKGSEGFRPTDVSGGNGEKWEAKKSGKILARTCGELGAQG